MECTIVIPVYKKNITPLEAISLARCITIFGPTRPIVLATYPGLDLTVYDEVFIRNQCHYSVSFFSKKYFESVKGYSKLLLRKKFYTTFLESRFILIYQLDAYVFSDQLSDWCSRSIDYIGAPFVTLFRKNEQSLKAWGVGNGGLSLRKTDSFISAYSDKGRVFSLGDYFSNTVFRHNAAYTLIKKIVYTPRYLFQWCFRNTVKYYIESSKVNEDIFWCFAFNHTVLTQVLSDASINRLFLVTSKYKGNSLITTAKTEEALLFAFDEAPQYCLELSKDILPMGCHAFDKQRAFWSHYITDLEKAD